MRIRSTADWLNAVEESDLPPWVRRVLNEYGSHMDALRIVSWPRAKIAKVLGISEHSVSKALTRAKEAGWIVVVEAGIRGRTASYQGTFGTPKTMGDMRYPKSHDVDRSSEGTANDRSEKVGYRQYIRLVPR